LSAPKNWVDCSLEELLQASDRLIAEIESLAGKAEELAKTHHEVTLELARRKMSKRK